MSQVAPESPPGWPQTRFVVAFGWLWNSFFLDFDITKSEKTNAKQLVFETNSRVDFVFFKSLENSFSDLLCPGYRLEIE